MIQHINGFVIYDSTHKQLIIYDLTLNTNNLYFS